MKSPMKFLKETAESSREYADKRIKDIEDRYSQKVITNQNVHKEFQDLLDEIWEHHQWEQVVSEKINPENVDDYLDEQTD